MSTARGRQRDQLVPGMYTNIAVRLTLFILWVTLSKSEIALDETKIRNGNVPKEKVGTAELSSHHDQKLSETESSIPRMTIGHLPDKPLQLVMPDNKQHRRLVLIEENVKHLHYIDGPVAVVAVVGKFHSGKSFLLNQLMGKNSGFGIGPTVQPHTMGIWMWGKPDHPRLFQSVEGGMERLILEPATMNLADGQTVSVIFLDTEGFAATNISETYDAKIFSVATLLSSYLIFNSVKIIDQADIDYLELLARRTRLFALRSQMSKAKWVDDFNHDLLTFPPLLWIVQDFVQLTLDETPQQWLHRLMGSKSSRDSEEHEISLLGIFDSVDCHTLFIPAMQKHLLQDLSQAQEDDLTSDYKQDRDLLLQKLQAKLLPKKKNSQTINGAELASLLRLLVAAANEGSLAAIPGRWRVFVDGLKETARGDCLVFYDAEMSIIHSKYEDGPINTTKLMLWHTSSANRSVTLLKQLLFGLDDAINASLVGLERDMADRFLKAQDVNQKRIQIKCTEVQRRMEVDAESQLDQVVFPVLTSDLEQKYREIKSNVLEKYRSGLSELQDSDYFLTSLDQLQNSLSNICDTYLLKNRQALEKLLETARDSAISHFRDNSRNVDGIPRLEAELERVLNGAELEALALYEREGSQARQESLFSAYYSMVKTGVSELKKTLIEENSQLVQSACEGTASELVRKFRDNTGPSKIALPLNETDLNKKLDVEMDLMLSEYSQLHASFHSTDQFKDVKRNLKNRLLLVCDDRHRDNVEAYTREVRVPLETARKIIMLSADNYDTVFSVRQYMSKVCLLNLNEGKPKQWEQSLKVMIANNFIDTDDELRRIIASRNSIWANIKGFCQWLIVWIQAFAQIGHDDLDQLT